ncbi:hypothetical protein [Sorangium sp. So ce131]|uniref:hypothetical protein n=1 Tax=Sorangium sp. So ce131 TaxID=3133282 RepID=UPI003F5DE671
MASRPALASLTVALGVVLLLGGTAHSAGVLRAFAAKGIPGGDRAAYLAFISLIHWTAGALDVLAGRGLRRGEPWTRGVLTISGLLVTAWGCVELPLLVDAPLLLRVMPVLYPAAHLGVLAALWGSGRTSLGNHG